jgi:PilZ domain
MGTEIAMATQAADRGATRQAVESNGQADSLKRQVQGLIDKVCAESDSERRNRDRFPIPYTFRLTPVDHDGIPMLDETTTVVGKDLSLTGIGFSHDHPLLYRRAVISLDHPKVGRFAVEAEIVWTRQTPIGLYESGCRLMRTANGHILLPKG